MIAITFALASALSSISAISSIAAITSIVPISAIVAKTSIAAMMQCYGLDYCNTHINKHMFTHYMSSDISQTVILQNEGRRCHAAWRLQ